MCLETTEDLCAGESDWCARSLSQLHSDGLKVPCTAHAALLKSAIRKDSEQCIDRRGAEDGAGLSEEVIAADTLLEGSWGTRRARRTQGSSLIAALLVFKRGASLANT